jgi:hypothetical protein
LAENDSNLTELLLTRCQDVIPLNIQTIHLDMMILQGIEIMEDTIQVMDGP